MLKKEIYLSGQFSYKSQMLEPQNVVAEAKGEKSEGEQAWSKWGFSNGKSSI